MKSWLKQQFKEVDPDTQMIILARLETVQKAIALQTTINDAVDREQYAEVRRLHPEIQVGADARAYMWSHTHTYPPTHVHTCTPVHAQGLRKDIAAFMSGPTKRSAPSEVSESKVERTTTQADIVFADARFAPPLPPVPRPCLCCALPCIAAATVQCVCPACYSACGLRRAWEVEDERERLEDA